MSKGDPLGVKGLSELGRVIFIITICVVKLKLILLVWSLFCDVQQELDESYHKKLEENKSQAEEKTAKRRAKR